MLVRVSVELLKTFGTRTEDGRKITAELGEPSEYATAGEPIYEPIFTTHEDPAHLCRCHAPKNHRAALAVA